MDAHKARCLSLQFPDSVLEGGYANHASRRAPGRQEILGFPFRLTPATVAPGPNSTGRYSVSSALPCIAFQRAKGARRVLQRGRLPKILLRGRGTQKLSCVFRGCIARTHV